MIPPIVEIVDDLLAGRITKQQAVTYLLVHAEDGGRDFRDDVAIAALQGMLASFPTDGVDRSKVDKKKWAEVAYEFADAVCEVRAQQE
jgi:hypothetical protein